MAQQMVVLEMEEELRDIEKRIEELLQRKAAVYACIANATPGGCLQSTAADSSTTASSVGVSPGVHSPSWASIVSGRKKKSAKKVAKNKDSYSAFGSNMDVSSPIPISPLPHMREGFKRTESTAAQQVVLVRGTVTRLNSSPASQRSVSRKRPASPVLSTDSQFLSSPLPGEKRPRLSPHQQVKSISPLPSGRKTVSLPLPSPITISAPPPSQPTRQVANSRDAQLATINSLSLITSLKSKLSIYSYNNDTERAQLLVVRDSIVRNVKLPGAFTYCLSGGKTSDFSELIPALLDVHPSVHTVLVHTGTNDVMSREPFKLQSELSSLVDTIQSLGKRCVLSGPLGDLFNSSERFSRLLSLHTWMQNYCSATDVDFISNFDYFWNQRDFFKRDRLHPNIKGTATLTLNFINCIAFSLN